MGSPSKLSVYALITLILGYVFYYTGVLNISLIYIVGFALVLNGLGTFLHTFGKQRNYSLFTAVYFFNSGLLLILLQKFKLMTTAPFIVSAIIFSTAIAFLLLFFEDSEKKKNLMYSVLLLAAGGVIMTLYRKLYPIDFILWLKEILGTFWIAILSIIALALISFRKEK